MQTYLFYDLETTGLNKAFDQILQFAAIRTDLQLNELERYEIKIKLNPDVIPAPRAVITHQISLSEMLTGVNEWEAMLQIHQWLNTPGTISLGYNTLSFDDEFLRFGFYRHLLTPYTHQYANQCARMDLYPMAAIYYLFKNEIIKWPNSLKLEHINTENQFVNGPSHQAMTDVEVTLALARQFFKEPETWTYITSYFNKAIDQRRADELALKEGLLIDGSFGAANAYQAPVLFLGNHLHYKNQTLWLRLDQPIDTNAWVVRKKWGEPGFVLPNKDRFLHYLSPERQQTIAANKAWLADNPQLFLEMAQYHKEYTYPVVPNVDIEASLYLQGFLSYEDENLCQQFHRSSPKQKAALTTQFKNPRLKQLATRMLGRHFRENMMEEQRNTWESYLQNEQIIDYKGQAKLSKTAALEEIALLLKENVLSERQIQLLDELTQHLNRAY